MNTQSESNRRDFLGTVLATSAMAALPQAADAASPKTLKSPIATNTYPWGTFHQREGRNLPLHSDALLEAVASAGMNGYEPIINAPAEFDGLAERLRAHGLEMRSLYVNSTLHDAAQAPQSLASVLAIARRAADIGVRIIVTNPSPIRWGGPENKTDGQLAGQARALDQLGAGLRKLGLILAYHNHDAELRCGAREFHHMLTATDPAYVKLCLDAHWVYRGCDNSQVALFDAVEHYGSRIVELHLRQSRSGTWTEVFGEGDIDYSRLAGWLQKHRIRPLLTLEQAVENGSPKTLTAIDAHRQSLANAKRIFAAFV